MSARVAVIGGGLAGITAALDCAAAGARVTLVEVRPRLGGAAYSFEREGLQMDNGQHVFLRCCTAYRALLARIGGERGVSVQRRLEIPVFSPDGPPITLRRSGLPAPLHLAGALARYSYLRLPQRLGAARAALALGRLDPEKPGLDERNLGEWLAAHGQDAQAVAALWDLIALPTLNLPAAQASLALGAFVFRKGLLERSDAGDIGFHRRPLSEIVGEPAERALRAAGVELLLGWRAQELRSAGAAFEVRGGEEGLSAEAVVVALPHARAAKLIEPLDPAAAARAGALREEPIVNLHVVYDRLVCQRPFAAGVRTPVQYVFDRSAAGGVGEGQQYLAVSLSGAEREMSTSVDELRQRFLPALAALFPRARAARVERFLVTREHAATFRAQPGSAALRCGPRTATPGLALAGAWTATGWPATLEGAVLQRPRRCALRAALPRHPVRGRPHRERARDAGGGRRGGERRMSDLLIAAPLRLEAAMIRIGLRRSARGARSTVPPPRVCQTGMGPRRAREAAAELRADPARRLLVMGFGGGLDELGEVGDAIVADAVIGPDGERVTCAGAEQLAAALLAGGMTVRRGVIASVERLAMGDARTQLRERGAVAVDMESVWLARAAGERPFAVVRIISDTPTRELTRPLATVAGVARAAAALARAAGPASAGVGEPQSSTVSP